MIEQKWLNYLGHEVDKGRIRVDNITTQELTPLPPVKTCAECPFLAKRESGQTFCAIFDDEKGPESDACSYNQTKNVVAGALLVLAGGLPGERKLWEASQERNEPFLNSNVEFF